MKRDNIPNELKSHRVRQKLRQEDMRRICAKEHNSILSRYEKGDKPPSFEIAMMYHITLGIPLKELFPHQYQALRKNIQQVLTTLLDELGAQPVNYKRYKRKLSLEDIVNRIGCLQQVYDETKQEKRKEGE